MSILADRRALLGAVHQDHHRRGFLAMLALPFVGLDRGHLAPTRTTPEDARVESPLDEGLEGPPRPVRTLDPSNPVALGLARLYDELRAAHGPEVAAKLALSNHDEAGEDIPDGPAWESHCEASKPLREAEDLAEGARRGAYFALMRAVIQAHGGGPPWLEEYYRYGTAHRAVRVGGRVYSVASDYDSDWPGDTDPDDHGSVVLSVIDL